MSDVELDDIAARALASMILERTADAVALDGINAGAALVALHNESGLSLDVCAGVMNACAWFVGAGELAPETIYAASLAIAPDVAPDDTANIDAIVDYP